ncbi:MAG: hypothetical protein H9535_07980 [Ignavibacteria bacterium]|nr:hypothetical protein [Ignavibacteria bacterium]
MMDWSVIKNNMQAFQGSATVLDEIINHGNDTIIIDVLLEDDSLFLRKKPRTLKRWW